MVDDCGSSRSRIDSLCSAASKFTMSASENSGADHQLVRAIGIPGLTANIVNSTIGAGIFALPAAVALQIGAASPVAYIICAVAMCLFVTCFAMAGSRVSLTGGLYAYVEVAFGGYFGFLAGALYFLTAILAISGIVGLIATSVSGMIPALATTLGRAVIIFCVLLFLVLINVRGVGIGARAVEAVTLIKLAPILIFIIAGVFFIRPEMLAWPGWPRNDALGRSILQLLFAFVGVEVALVPSGEVKNPARTVPRAIFLSLGMTTILYILIQLVALGVLGPALGELWRYGIGGSRFPISRKSWTNFNARGTGRFRFRVCDERYPELASNPFRFRTRCVSTEMVCACSSAISHAGCRDHHLRRGRVRSFVQLNLSKTRRAFEHGGAVALHSVLPRRARIESTRCSQRRRTL